MPKRPECQKCGFILARCLCETLRPIANATHLIILQHPSESAHALGTVALMTKSFLNITLFIGEDFSEHQELNELIELHHKTLALIYPTDDCEVLKNDSTTPLSHPLTHLLFIDGTWKKARKIFQLSKNLHALKSFKLESTSRGLYQIRSTTIEHGFSTLEASLLALNILEKNLDTSSLLQSFKKMIDFQIEKMGEETFRKNYGNSED